jgi:dolichol-phosphate mannosyltransferase
MRKFSLIVPVYNEVEALPFTCERLRHVAGMLHSNAAVGDVEFIFVNDGSTDGSEAVLKTERTKFINTPGCTCKVLTFSRNFGHSAAVFAGMSAVEGDLIGIIDADLQDPPELLVDMIHSLDKNNADVVFGQRLTRQGEGRFKKISAWLFYRLLNMLSGVEIPQDTGDFRVMTREVCDVVAALTEREPFLRGLVAWVGYKQVPFSYERQARQYGTTKYPLLQMFRFATQAIISFSLLPLRCAVYLGLFGVACSSLLAAFAFKLYWSGKALPGWASIIVGFTFGQSTTLLVVGIIGVYLGRVHMSLQRRPRYILRKEQKRSSHLSIERQAK